MFNVNRVARSRGFACAAWVASITLIADASWAIPSPVNHTHTAATVHWKDPGSPALPWTDAVSNMWNHNHLTADPFDNGLKWKIDKSWDNRTIHNSNDGGPAQFGHGLIEASTPVRYLCDATVPADAADEIKFGYDKWMELATAQFDLKKDATDILAMNFQRVTTGDDDISIVFANAINGAYAYFNGSNQIAFLTAPSIRLRTNAPEKRIRKVGTGANSSEMEVPTPWSYDGDPDALPDIDLEYSDDEGMSWNTLPPMGFGDLIMVAATPNQTINAGDTFRPFEMDFRTIALHEIGHSIGLAHTGFGIMRTDIADKANFSNTLGIEADAALAAAINYTYSVVPEPTSAAGATAMICLAIRRRRRLMPRGSPLTIQA